MEWNWTGPIRPMYLYIFLFDQAVEDSLVCSYISRLGEKVNQNLNYVIKNDMTAVVLKKRVSVVVEIYDPTLKFIGYNQLKSVCYLSRYLKFFI